MASPPYLNPLLPISQRLDPLRTRPQAAPVVAPPSPTTAPSPGIGGGGAGGRSGPAPVAPARTGAQTPTQPRETIDRGALIPDLVGRVTPIFAMAGLERALRPMTLLPERLLGAPSAREQATWIVQHPVESAVAGGLGIAAGAAVAPLLIGGGAVTLAGGATIVTGGAARGIGGSAIGTATGTVVDTGIKLAVGAGLMGALASQHRTANLPSGLPDWMDKWQDPHGGVGGGGAEIPSPDWMSGDPEVGIDPGVDWRSPGESFEDYLSYRRELPSEGPAGRGPVPYYTGPEIAQPGPASRFIDSPDLPLGQGLGIMTPELRIGPESRTIGSPEIIVPRGERFAPELPINMGRDIFPREIPGEGAPDLVFRFPSEWGERLTGDRLVTEIRTPKYSDAILTAGSVAIGRSRPGGVPRGFTEEIIDNRILEVPRDRAVPGLSPLDRLEAGIMKDFGDLTFSHVTAAGPEVKAREGAGPLGRLENLARSQLNEITDATPTTLPDADAMARALALPGSAAFTGSGLTAGTGTGADTTGFSFNLETPFPLRTEYVRMPGVPAFAAFGVAVPDLPTEFSAAEEFDLRRDRKVRRMKMDPMTGMGSVTIENLTPTIESVFGRGGMKIKMPKFRY